MQVLSELTIPYLKVGGRLLALKASNAPEELEEAKNALNLLFSKVEDNLQYELPNGGSSLHYCCGEEKKKHPINTQEKQVCPISDHYKTNSKEADSLSASF